MAGARGVWNIAAMAERYGPAYKLQLLQAVVVVLSDPQTISRVSRKTGEQSTGSCLLGGRPAVNRHAARSAAMSG